PGLQVPGLGAGHRPERTIRSGDDASEGMTAEGSAGEQGPPWDFGRAGPDGSGPDGAGSDGARSEPARLESPDFEEVGAWPVAALLEEMATGGAAPACGSAAAGAAGVSAAAAGEGIGRAHGAPPGTFRSRRPSSAGR